MGEELLEIDIIERKIKGKKHTALRKLMKSISSKEEKSISFIFEVEDVRGAARPRSTIRTGKNGGHFIQVYTISKDRMYKADIANYIRSELDTSFKPLVDKALRVTIKTYRKTPKSFSLTKKWLAEKGLLRPATKPDIDNIAKLPLDAMNGLIYRDDIYIVDLHVSKYYSLSPRIEISVTWELQCDV